MMYGYSPFEIRFDNYGRGYCEEASYLKIINGVVYPQSNDLVSNGIKELINILLNPDPSSRPYIDEIIKLIPTIRLKINTITKL